MAGRRCRSGSGAGGAVSVTADGGGVGAGEAVQRGDGRGQPLGRRMMQVVERDERAMEQVGAARRSAPAPPAAAWP